MTIALVQQGTDVRQTTTVPITSVLTTTPTPGNLMVGFFVANNSSAAATPSGWQQIAFHVATSATAAIYMKTAGSSESTSQVYTPVAGTGNQWFVVEFSGLTTPTWDQTGGADSGAATGLSADSGTTGPMAVVGELAVANIFATSSPAGTFAASNGFTLLNHTQRMLSAYKVLSDTSATSTTFSWTTTVARTASSIASIAPAPFVVGHTGWGLPISAPATG